MEAEVLKMDPNPVLLCVIEKQRDINFKSDEGSLNGILTLGVGYTADANFYCIGGNNVHQTQIPGTIFQNNFCYKRRFWLPNNSPQVIVSAEVGVCRGSTSKDNAILELQQDCYYKETLFEQKPI